MVEEDLLIHQLAERAHISIRTIRYYIDEGLLPQPNYQGKYSYYSRQYLDRLELIRRLKESFLPLREIREIMTSLSDEDVRRKLHEKTFPRPRVSAQPLPAPSIEKPGEKALQYINRLMDDQARYKTKGQFEKKSPQDVLQADFQVGANALLQAPPVTPVDEDWQRITLAPGVELHLRRPLEPQVQSRARQLIIYAQKIFNLKP